VNNSISESRVNFKVAKLLREKGFNVMVSHCYNSIGLELEAPHTNSVNVFVSSPSQSVVIDWLQENFGIYVESYVDDDKTFGYYITKFSEIGRSSEPMRRQFLSRKIAIDEALLYTLENLV
jgi:hypothetical protein